MQLTYPGVYVTEIPSSVRPIATVATSIAAFVDWFITGPVDEAVQIFGMADFERIYGGVHENSAASYQVAQFFLNGGSSAWIVRVAPGGATAKTIVKKDAGATQAFTATARSKGDWGNAVRLSVEPVVVSNKVVSDRFSLVVTRYAAESGSNAIIASERYSNLSKADFASAVNDASQLVSLDAGTPPVGVQPAATGTLASKKIPPVVHDLDSKKLKVKVGGGTAIDVELKVPAGVSDVAPNKLTNENVRAMLESALRLAGANEAGAEHTLVGATVSLVGERLWIRIDPRTTGYDPKITIEIGDGPTPVIDKIGLDGAFPNVQEYKLGIDSSPGAQKGALSDHGADGPLPDPIALNAGIVALERVDLFNILCLPRAAELDDAQMTSVLSHALHTCESRRAMLIVDIPPSKNTPALVHEWLDDNASTVSSPNAALYFPRVNLPDPTDGFRVKAFPNSGTIAGIWAKTDVDRGVWKAPAGIDAILRGVAGLEYLMSDGENGVLNPLGIDCLRNFPVYGQVVWGARTLFGADARASEWKYLPIKRLALMIEESLFRGTKWVVFEPNDEPLWAKIRQNVGAFMTTLFRQGAFQGSTPDKAFFVKCDGETTTAADRNLGIVNIEVGFAPLKPAEFVVLKIQQIPQVI